MLLLEIAKCTSLVTLCLNRSPNSPDPTVVEVTAAPALDSSLHLHEHAGEDLIVVVNTGDVEHMTCLVSAQGKIEARAQRKPASVDANLNSDAWSVLGAAM